MTSTHLVKPFDSSMQAVGPVVNGQFILLPIQFVNVPLLPGWPPCQPQLQSRAAFGGTLQGYGMTTILKTFKTKDEVHTAAHHFLLRAAVSINNMGIPRAWKQGKLVFFTHDPSFPKAIHIFYKHFKRLKHKEET